MIPDKRKYANNADQVKVQVLKNPNKMNWQIIAKESVEICQVALSVLVVQKGLQLSQRYIVSVVERRLDKIFEI